MTPTSTTPQPGSKVRAAIAHWTMLTAQAQPIPVVPSRPRPTPAALLRSRPTPPLQSKPTPTFPQGQPRPRPLIIECQTIRLTLPRKLVMTSSDLYKYRPDYSKYQCGQERRGSLTTEERMIPRVWQQTRRGPYPEVIKLTWKAGKLDATILSLFPNIQVLKCSGQNLSNIDAVAVCKKLSILKCSNNSIANVCALKACTELTEIECNHNRLVSLVGLSSPKLKTIRCMCNRLTSLEGLESCAELTYIDCSNNEICNINALRGCKLLTTLRCDHNKLTTLCGLEGCPDLKNIQCYSNLLTSIEDLAECINLEVVICHSNKLGHLKGLESKAKLTHIDARHNKIETIEGLAGSVALKILQLEINRIRSTRGLGSCPDLQQLTIENNQLSEFVLEYMPNLKRIICSGNLLTSLEGLAACPALDYLSCSNDRLSSLTGIEGCSALTTIYCRNNLIDSLRPLTSLPKLRRLECENNQLVTLEGIERCRNMRILDCRSNQITSLELVLCLRNLEILRYDNNPIGPITQHLEHFLYMVEERSKGLSVIYNNDENVMNDAVKKSTYASIKNIMKDPTPNFSLRDLNGSGLSIRSIEWLTEACHCTDRQRDYLINYRTLLGYIWQRIESSEHKSELIKILGQQISESKDRCLTGRMTRLLSVLMGFYDDIHIAISTSSQIHAAIKVVEKSLSPYCAKTHRDLVAAHLHDLGYSDVEARPWLDAIYDPEDTDS